MTDIEKISLLRDCVGFWRDNLVETKKPVVILRKNSDWQVLMINVITALLLDRKVTVIDQNGQESALVKPLPKENAVIISKLHVEWVMIRLTLGETLWEDQEVRGQVFTCLSLTIYPED